MLTVKESAEILISAEALKRREYASLWARFLKNTSYIISFITSKNIQKTR